MTPFAIAGVQMYVNALQSNVDGMIQRLDILMARFPWTQMVLFSELAPYGPLDRFALPQDNETLEKFQQAARKHRVWLIPGSMFLKNSEDGRVYNTAVVINPEGEIIRRYSKMFPFRPYEAGIAAGTEFCVFDVPEVGRFGLSICYDIWFPETTRQLTSQGVEVLLNPVLTGTTDRDAELAIARATAAQFQCYVVAVNGLGAGGVGKSCVVDPTSMVLHQSAGQEDMFPIEIDLSMVRRQRETGMKGLGQVLKSFRDRSTDFSVYDRNSGTDAYLKTLGPLEIPHQGTRAGLHVDVPSQLIPEAPTFKGQEATLPFSSAPESIGTEPMPNASAGTANPPSDAQTTAAPAAAMPNLPVKPGIFTDTADSSSG
ncbi:carbon-nitrogen hydrolase family protein [Sulfitobacter sp. SK011]|uniref:carbon-nitrogen hydrolase family protein n=1 Tax=Sulfitobacter sp. SK011 TaxID=1389004 RepID=UPI000E0B2AA6|nr:carbon-nitrogen hydrolase family protein [Sulfitobacter sp. SK011]AXI40540.1 carbon-nitrogen hydrolase family protein [Sulfitobacter sp. SK011]